LFATNIGRLSKMSTALELDARAKMDPTLQIYQPDANEMPCLDLHIRDRFDPSLLESSDDLTFSGDDKDHVPVEDKVRKKSAPRADTSSQKAPARDNNASKKSPPGADTLLKKASAGDQNAAKKIVPHVSAIDSEEEPELANQIGLHELSSFSRSPAAGPNNKDDEPVTTLNCEMEAAPLPPSVVTNEMEIDTSDSPWSPETALDIPDLPMTSQTDGFQDFVGDVVNNDSGPSKPASECLYYIYVYKYRKLNESNTCSKALSVSNCG
jgi:hypothetical protein